MGLTDDDIAAMVTRWEKATPGRWQSFLERRDRYPGSDFIRTDGNDLEIHGGTPEDQEFIAHAKQDIPRLIEELKRLRKLLAEAGVRG